MTNLRSNYKGYQVNCTVCGRVKQPAGRSVPAELYDSLCGGDCQGYYEEPRPSSLWPGESEEDFGYPVAR